MPSYKQCHVTHITRGLTMVHKAVLLPLQIREANRKWTIEPCPPVCVDTRRCRFVSYIIALTATPYWHLSDTYNSMNETLWGFSAPDRQRCIQRSAYSQIQRSDHSEIQRSSYLEIRRSGKSEVQLIWNSYQSASFFLSPGSVRAWWHYLNTAHFGSIPDF